MKRKGVTWLALWFLALAALLTLRCAEPPPEDDLLDLGRVPVRDPAAQDLIGADSIRVRRPDTPYQPSGVLPVLEFEGVTDLDCRDLLDRLVKQYTLEGQVVHMPDILAFQGPDVALWVSRASGAFKLTRTRHSMATTASIDAHEALQIALEHVAEEQLVQLADGEELDVLFVSAVMNAVGYEDDVPVDAFLSDHYVGFGRRYRGVPVVGSQLVLRLDGQGDVAMIHKVWRRVQQFDTAEARVTRTPLEELIVTAPEFQERLSGTRVAAGDIHIVERRCGYLEAPVDSLQRELRPGCEVAFRVGDGGDEGLAQMVVSLEDGVTRDRLLGARFDGRGPEFQP